MAYVLELFACNSIGRNLVITQVADVSLPIVVFNRHMKLNSKNCSHIVTKTILAHTQILLNQPASINHDELTDKKNIHFTLGQGTMQTKQDMEGENKNGKRKKGEWKERN